MGSRSKYKPRPFESQGEKFKDDKGKIRNDSSANIFESMLLHKAFKTLKTRQKLLYVYCKSQYFGHRKPQQDNPNLEQAKGAEKFYFWFQLGVDYGLYAPSMQKEFYQDMEALEAHGLIKTVAQGHYPYTRTIYELDSRWRTWKEPKESTPQETIAAWQQSHPEGTKYACCKETGLSKPTVKKYWSELKP